MLSGSDPPAVSVIVPMHDVAAHAGAAIASLRAQTFAGFEAIVVDDGSSDGSGDVALAAMAGDARFRLVRQPNRGLSAARNAGLAAARGRFIAFLDGDDRLAPEFLARMLAALESDGGAWVACAVADCWQDGRRTVHPAIHGAAMPDGPRRWPLEDWAAVIAHYPSVWNKLYRRDLIGDTRFAEGLWFEDHAFYMTLAARAGHILHLPEPLYWQTRGRPGQITATDSDRIFDQFTVLEGVRRLMAGPALPGGAAGFARLASRLLAERAPTLRDADRRARWLGAARAFLAGQGVAFEAAQAPSLAQVLDGGVPVSVVLALGHDDAAASLAALAAQDIAGLEIVLAGPGAGALAEAARAACPGRGVQAVDAAPGSVWHLWAAGAAVARGAGLVLWRAGDGAEPIALRHWADAGLRQDADLVVSAFRVPGTGGYRDGWADPAGLAGPCTAGPPLAPAQAGAQPFHPLLAAKLLAAPLARAVLAGADDLAAAAPLDDMAAMARVAALARCPVWVDFPAAQPRPRPLPAPGALIAALASPALAGAEPRRLAVRGLRMAVDLRPPGQALRLALWLLAARAALRRAGLARGAGPLDPGITRRFARLLGLVAR